MLPLRFHAALAAAFALLSTRGASADAVVGPKTAVLEQLRAAGIADVEVRDITGRTGRTARQ